MENHNELIDVKNDVSINKLSQFINIFKNVKDAQNEVVHLSVQVELCLKLCVRWDMWFLFF